MNNKKKIQNNFNGRFYQLITDWNAAIDFDIYDDSFHNLLMSFRDTDTAFTLSREIIIKSIKMDRQD